MKESSPADVAAEKIASALKGIEAENPHLKEILQAFQGMLLEQARWKAELPALDCSEIAPPDPERFTQGVPLTDRAWLSRLGDLWPSALKRVIPALILGFPKIQPELDRLQTAILQQALLRIGFSLTFSEGIRPSPRASPTGWGGTRTSGICPDSGSETGRGKTGGDACPSHCRACLA